MYIDPMLLERSDNPFNSAAHIFEPKIDGHRLILSKTKDETRLWTRHHNECTRHYPELWNVPIEGDVILDGEVCVIDPDTGEIGTGHGKVPAQKAQQDPSRGRLPTGSVRRVRYLFYKGKDLREMPLLKRRSMLYSRRRA